MKSSRSKGDGVLCPDCFGASLVRDSRRDKPTKGIRRRRDCLSCGLRFTTVETVVTGEAEVSRAHRAAAHEIVRRYLVLGGKGRATVRSLLAALEEAAIAGARHEAEAVAAEDPAIAAAAAMFTGLEIHP